MKKQPRKFWEELQVVEVTKQKAKQRLKVVLGADDPSTLRTEEAFELARVTAKKRGYEVADGMTDVAVFGQNNLALRAFYYK